MEQDGEPKDEGLGETGALVWELLVQLQRTQTAYQLYSPNNRLRADALERLKAAFDAVLAETDPLLLNLEPDRVRWQGEVILDASQIENHCLVRLYHGGIRQLAFAAGLDGPEIASFLSIVAARAMTRTGDHSLPDEFWEADLRHVCAVAVDGFTEILTSEDNDSRRGTASGGPQIATTRFAQLIEMLTAGTSATETTELKSSSSVPLDLSDPLARRILAAEMGKTPLPSESEWIDVEIAESESLTSIEQLLIEAIILPDARFPEWDAILILTKLLDEYFRTQRFDNANSIAERLEELGVEHPDKNHVFEQVLAQASGYQSFRSVCQTETQQEQTESSALGFFKRHGTLTDDDLQKSLHEPTSEAGRDLLGQLVGARVEERPGYWIPYAQTFPTSILLRVMNHLQESEKAVSRELLKFYWQVFNHYEPDARAVAMRAYPGDYDPQFRQLLLGAIIEEESVVRKAAIIRLSESGDATVGSFLVNRLRQTIGDLDNEEIGLLLDAVVEIGGERYLPFFRQQIDSLGGFRGLDLTRDVKTLIPRSRISRIIQLLVAAVAKIGTPGSIELVREVRAQARGKLRRFCDDLWRQVITKWREDTENVPAISESTVSISDVDEPIETEPSSTATPAQEKQPFKPEPSGVVKTAGKKKEHPFKPAPSGVVKAPGKKKENPFKPEPSGIIKRPRTKPRLPNPLPEHDEPSNEKPS